MSSLSCKALYIVISFFVLQSICLSSSLVYFKNGSEYLLYTLPMNISGYASFLILLYTLPMSINGYIPFLMNKLDTIVRGG